MIAWVMARVYLLATVAALLVGATLYHKAVVAYTDHVAFKRGVGDEKTRAANAQREFREQAEADLRKRAVALKQELDAQRKLDEQRATDLDQYAQRLIEWERTQGKRPAWTRELLNKAAVK